ncbi:MAG: HdeD family acid-resistance protein [Halobacteriota archaeon]|uniref:HdeD family acid-resistance protein n=1 Tax=Natronomonas sp. TaxID=2184060 RepID=UPI00397679C8
MNSTTREMTSEPIAPRRAVVGGIVIALLGVLAIMFPFVTGLSLSILLGGVLVIGALVHAAHAFGRERSRGSRLLQAVLGVLYGVAGISLLVNPVFGLVTLTLLVVAFLFLDGIVEIAWAVRVRGQQHWVWLLVSGVISLVAAGLLWMGLPSTAIWAVGFLFGVNLLATGIAMAVYGRGAMAIGVEDETPISG